METKLSELHGVGPKSLYHFRNQNIWSTYDLILRYPKAYEDFTVDHIHHLKHKEVITISGKITTPIKENPYARTHVSKFHMEVFGDQIEIIAFNRKYLSKQFVLNDEIVVKGTYDLYKHQVIASTIIKKEKNIEIKPIYKIEGLYDRTIHELVKTIFYEKKVDIYETLLEQDLAHYQMPKRLEAFKMLHLPKSFDDVKVAKRRFKYEEAFYLNLRLFAELKAKQTPRQKITYDIQSVKDFIAELPFELTKDQKEAVNDIYKDYQMPHHNQRLIQGDVGSGKTIVALLATLPFLQNRKQVAFMAPTELLATQHYQTFKNLLKDANILLLTSKTKQKDIEKTIIKQGDYDIIIGTHALIEDDVIFNDLGLIIIDEQHKFGVDTRSKLMDKTDCKDALFLTATPIPRTLAMVAFGESNLSIIKSKPKERQKIETYYINQKDSYEIYDAIDQTCKNKEHVFVVVPAIDSNKTNWNIDNVYEQLSLNTHHPMFMLHGKQKKDEQEKNMNDFMMTPGSILLATTMVEVGIDIPTASLMVIYGAEHFGLAQLHQLRGRVGRSSLKSRCLLVSEKADVERLNMLTSTEDGFKLAAYDLQERGPGDFLGKQQSGYLDFHFLDLLADQKILLEASKNVEALMKETDFNTNPKYKYFRRHIKNTIKL